MGFVALNGESQGVIEKDYKGITFDWEFVGKWLNLVVVEREHLEND